MKNEYKIKLKNREVKERDQRERENKRKTGGKRNDNKIIIKQMGKML